MDSAFSGWLADRKPPSGCVWHGGAADHALRLHLADLAVLLVPELQRFREVLLQPAAVVDIGTLLPFGGERAENLWNMNRCPIFTC